jgi:hypothetical protein
MLKEVLLFVLKFSHKPNCTGFEYYTYVKYSNLSFVPSQSEPSTIVNAVNDWAHQFTNIHSCLLKYALKEPAFCYTNDLHCIALHLNTDVKTQICLLCLTNLNLRQ